MSQPFTILFSGGGSLGHVVPSMAVAAAVKAKRPDARCVFVCADRAEETGMLRAAGYAYQTLHAPKFPHGFSPAFLTFPFSFVAAFLRSKKIIDAEKPQVVFSKGGFASVPLVIAARMRHIPVVLHESDSVLSLSSGLIAKVADRICTGFPGIELPPAVAAKATHTGNPVRTDILRGSEAAGQRITGFSGRRPVVMIIGGSQGSLALNAAVQDSLQSLVDIADVIHLTGKGKAVTADHARYFVRETVIEELPHLYAFSDVIVSRTGAGVLSELAALKKPVITVPLTGVARDHQMKNAKALESRGAVVLLRQEDLSQLTASIKNLLADPARRTKLGEALATAFPAHAAESAADAILAALQTPRV